MKSLHFTLGILAICLVSLPLQAKDIHSLDLYRFRISQQLHQELSKDFRSDQYTLRLDLQGQKRTRFAGEGVEILKANGSLQAGKKVLPQVTDLLGEVDYEITQATVELTLIPEVQKEQIAELRANISRVAKLSESRGDQIQITARILQPIAVKTKPIQQTEALQVKSTSPLASKGIQAGGMVLLILLAMVALVKKKRATPTTPSPEPQVLEEQTKAPMDIMDALQAEEAAEALDQYNELQKETLAFAEILEEQQEQAAPLMDEIQIDEITFKAEFEFLTMTQLEGIRQILKGEAPSVKAWVLRSLRPERANTILAEIPVEQRKDLIWELGHLSLYDQAEVAKIEARLQAKQMKLDASLTTGIKLAHSSKKSPKAVQFKFEFETLSNLPGNLLTDLTNQVDLGDLMIAAFNGSKKLKEKIILALEQEKRRQFLLQSESLKPNVEDSLIHQERVIKRLQEIATHRKIDLTRFKSA